MPRALVTVLALCLSFAFAPVARAQQSDLQSVLQDNQDAVANPSRSTVNEVIDALVASGLPGVAEFLSRWQEREVVVRQEDGLFFYIEDDQLIDIATGEAAGPVPDDGIDEVRPNGGVRRELAGALVQFQLSSPDIAERRAALDAISGDMSADQIEPLAASIEDEPSARIAARKERLLAMLTARFGEDTEARVEAIRQITNGVSVELRGVLNQILTTSDEVSETVPEDVNVARTYVPGEDMSLDAAYSELVERDLAPPRVSDADIYAALTQNIADGAVGGVPVEELSDPARRIDAYEALAAEGTVPGFVGPDDMAAAVDAYSFYAIYDEPDPAVTDAARAALDGVETRVGLSEAADLSLDALSLASIYFLAAIGLAVTFGVMGVINMAHGEFIMMGAYTGYVVQSLVPNYTISIILALPLAFAVTFALGVAMERLVIRWLYHRPLETLLATFGISIALQQLAKNIFGTQARPFTAPDWLAGSMVVSDVISISFVRIAIFVLGLFFLGLLLFILKRTRLGLEVRAVTQNPRMAASMGINPERINMLTFGLGSGIAGIAGVAIGLYAQVTSEMGSNYIVQSFMTVVVGGVGNVWGTLAGATLIGFLQKGIEWFNPSNTLAAQTFMILFIILFIQFRPRGIVALKGRAAGD
ncbi:branched-chain amino acid ABC transporter permease [Roseivivax marinus]|uniref:Branched-chain amino acid ABC transporter permease n=1 Tax=Roseivivax marinus TaxID=1379903 RepID=W4HH58_9RHOB|nr:urea ABC transporter permease subunit UrtB [Roseivivax marinus]ETW12087.1 branched-chain amino acid ABC transporter permease [Roseivivax marinus]